jgi:hypothetical protein
MNQSLILVGVLFLGTFTVGQALAQDEAPMKMGQAGPNTFVGLVSDASCGPRHKMRDKSAEECTRACERAGSPYALVAGEKVYRLKGDSNDIAVLAGQKAKITGTLQGDTIAVTSAMPTQ